jgi:hypothetical protein
VVASGPESVSVRVTSHSRLCTFDIPFDIDDIWRGKEPEKNGSSTDGFVVSWARSEFLQTREEACRSAQVLWKKNEGEK